MRLPETHLPPALGRRWIDSLEAHGTRNIALKVTTLKTASLTSPLYTKFLRLLTNQAKKYFLLYILNLLTAHSMKARSHPPEAVRTRTRTRPEPFQTLPCLDNFSSFSCCQTKDSLYDSIHISESHQPITPLGENKK